MPHGSGALAQVLCLYSEDQRKAVMSFLEKREPEHWQRAGALAKSWSISKELEY